MFSENHTESSSEPGFDRDITLEGVPGQSKMANTDKEPSAEEKLNPEPSGSRIDKELSDHKPGTDDDIDVPIAWSGEGDGHGHPPNCVRW